MKVCLHQTDDEPHVFARGSFFIATEGRDRDIFFLMLPEDSAPFYSLSSAGFRGLLPLKTRKEAPAVPSSSYCRHCICTLLSPRNRA